MSLGHGVSISRSGLILHLDAANIKSYPGTGTVWSDTSTTLNNGTLVNNPTYSSVSKGVFTISTAANNLVTFASNPTLANSTTIDLWANWSLPSANNYLMFGREGCYRVNFNGGYLSWVCATVNNTWYSNGTVVTVNTSTNGWKNFVFTYDGQYLYIYINGTLIANTSAAFPISGNVRTTGNNLKLWFSDVASIYPANGQFGAFKMYNRALTSQEIQQNFNALRGRYGI